MAGDWSGGGIDHGGWTAPPDPLVTGMSGAGSVEAVLGIGHEAVDNLPVAGAGPGRPGRFVQPPDRHGISRTRSTPAPAGPAGDSRGRHAEVGPFLTATTLLRRYTETRRRHPLALDRPVADGTRPTAMAAARPCRTVIDSTPCRSTICAQLKRIAVGGEPGLFVQVTRSPSAAVCRARPTWSSTCASWTTPAGSRSAAATGLDEPVQQAVAADRDLPISIDTGLLSLLLPRYNQEGKAT